MTSEYLAVVVCEGYGLNAFAKRSVNASIWRGGRMTRTLARWRSLPPTSLKAPVMASIERSVFAWLTSFTMSVLACCRAQRRRPSSQSYLPHTRATAIYRGITTHTIVHQAHRVVILEPADSLEVCRAPKDGGFDCMDNDGMASGRSERSGRSIDSPVPSSNALAATALRKRIVLCTSGVVRGWRGGDARHLRDRSTKAASWSCFFPRRLQRLEADATKAKEDTPMHNDRQRFTALLPPPFCPRERLARLARALMGRHSKGTQKHKASKARASQPVDLELMLICSRGPRTACLIA